MIDQTQAAVVHDRTDSWISWIHIVGWIAIKALEIVMVAGALAGAVIWFLQARSKRREGEAT